MRAVCRESETVNPITVTEFFKSIRFHPLLILQPDNPDIIIPIVIGGRVNTGDPIPIRRPRRRQTPESDGNLYKVFRPIIDVQNKDILPPAIRNGGHGEPSAVRRPRWRYVMKGIGCQSIHVCPIGIHGKDIRILSY